MTSHRLFTVLEADDCKVESKDDVVVTRDVEQTSHRLFTVWKADEYKVEIKDGVVAKRDGKHTSHKLLQVLEADECNVDSKDGVVAKRDCEQVFRTNKSDLEGADTTDKHLVLVQKLFATMTISDGNHKTKESHTSSGSSSQKKNDQFMVDSKVNKDMMKISTDIEHTTAKKQDEEQAQTTTNLDVEGTMRNRKRRREWHACLSPHCSFYQSGYNEEPYTKYAGCL